MNRCGAYAVGALLAAALLLITGATAEADLLDGVGAMGGSTSDEYQFYAPRSTARNWVEILTDLRGWNFGSFTTESRGDSRRAGYEYNWAVPGATTERLLNEGQHTGVAAQVATGDVSLVFVWIGTNDFRAVLNASSPQPLPTVTHDAVTNTIDAINTVLRANPDVRVVVGTLDDLRHSPEARLGIESGRLTQMRMDEFSAAVQEYNTRIRVLAASDSRLAVADLFTLFEDIMASEQLIVGGMSIDRVTVRAEPDHFWNDELHPGTVGQALIANTFIDAINAQFGANVPNLTEAEIVRAANLSDPDSLRDER